MKKYYFVNFKVAIKSTDENFTHMSILSTDKGFFPILEAKLRIQEVFNKDSAIETNVIINNFIEVTEESFFEFHKDGKSSFAEL